MLLLAANKATSRQKYNIMKDGRDRKDKDGNLHKLCLIYTKGDGYKDKGKRTE